MKSITKMAAALLCAAMMMAVLAGCGTTPKEKVDVLDDKGAANKIPTPQWVIESISGGNRAVEKMPEYKNEYCFVVTQYSSNRDYALAWVNNLSGPIEVGRMVMTTVHDQAAGGLQGRSDGNSDVELKSELTNIREAYTDAAITGVQKMGDWWQTTRNRTSKEITTQAFALFVVEKGSLDKQLMAILQNVVDNNAALSEAARELYQEVIAGIRSRGFTNN